MQPQTQPTTNALTGALPLGAFSISQAPNLEELGARFLRYADISQASIKTYGKALAVFFDWLMERGEKNPTRETLIDYRREMIATRKPTTAASYINALKQFFKWLSFEGFTPVNLAEHLKGAKMPKGFRKDALTEGQARDLIQGIDTATLEGKRDLAIIALATTCALRTIEIVRADIGDMRPQGGYMALYVQGKGRTSKDEIVKVSDQTERIIRDYLAARGVQDPKAPLFASLSDRNSGGRLTTNSVSRIVKTRLRACGLDSDRLTAHSLRHTGITLALLNGSTLAEAQQMARHSSINTTMVYNHAIERANNKSEDRISEAIFAERI